MRPRIKDALKNFTNAVKPVKDLMNGIRLDAPKALKNGSVRAQHEAIQCASVVVMSGYLESFVRDLAKAFFDELRTRGIGLQLLAVGEPDTKFLQTHLRNGARILQDLSTPKLADLAECESFLRKIHAPFSNEAEPPVWEAFAVTEANPGPKVLKNFLKNLGVVDPFNAVSLAVRGRYSQANFDSLLTAFILVRNECAHTGRARQVPAPASIDDYVDLLRALSLGMCRVVDKRISSF